MVRSVLGAETVGLADACNFAIIIQHYLKQILRKTLTIKVLTVIKTLFNVIIRNGSTTRMRLIIDVKAAREAYDDGIIDDVICIRRNFNLADLMTKTARTPEFVEALHQNQLHYEIEQSVNRKIRSTTNETEKVRV